jgi:hypothetical protein
MQWKKLDIFFIVAPRDTNVITDKLQLYEYEHHGCTECRAAATSLSRRFMEPTQGPEGPLNQSCFCICNMQKL